MDDDALRDVLIKRVEDAGLARIMPTIYPVGGLVFQRQVHDGDEWTGVCTPTQARAAAALHRLTAEKLEKAAATAQAVRDNGCRGSA